MTGAKLVDAHSLAGANCFSLEINDEYVATRACEALFRHVALDREGRRKMRGAAVNFMIGGAQPV